jgi:mannobiose 2-epimerase
MVKEEILEHLVTRLIPFWTSLHDDHCGGYYGEVDYDLKVNKKADKGCILNSRILWFFSSAATLLKDEDLLKEAEHAYIYLRDHFLDPDNGGVFWAVSYNGVVSDTTKHTYNQAFAIYALAAYFEASGDTEALELAFGLYALIEEACRDQYGYKDSFDEFFREITNHKLSENGIIAQKTMNTVLHIMEAYTELYRVTMQAEAQRAADVSALMSEEKAAQMAAYLAMPTAPLKELKHRLEEILSFIAEKLYNPELRRLEVFFDEKMCPILNLHSYGHDIEAAWLIDRAVDVLGNRSYLVRMKPISAHLSEQIYKTAFDGNSLLYEAEEEKVNENRVWWVQAEAIVGFLYAYEREPERHEYLDSVKNIWRYVKKYLIDKRINAEWYSEVDKNGQPIPGLAIVDEWKCPYHNGRMCLEILKSKIEF